MSERMASKCGGKRRYTSERKADVNAGRTQMRTGVAMRSYPCEFCRGWHVGSVALHARPERQLPRRERYAAADPVQP